MSENQEQVQKTSFYKQWWFIGLIILLLIGIFSSGEENTDTNQNVVSEQEKVEAVSTNTESDVGLAVPQTYLKQTQNLQQMM